MRYEPRYTYESDAAGETKDEETEGDGEEEEGERKMCETFNRHATGLSPEEYLKERHWKSLSARISSILNIKWAMRFFPP